MRRMKDSGIAWIGEIPEEWETKKARFLFQQRLTKGSESGVLLASTQNYGIIPQYKIEGAVKVKEDTNLQLFKRVEKNDFVISLRSFQGGIEHSEYDGVCSPAYQVFFNTTPLYHHFFKYLFKSHIFISILNNLSLGIRDGKNIQYKDVECLYLPFPPLPEQHRIAAYLDDKCAEIDRSMELARQGIDKLKAYRMSVITEAVTKGLDPDVPMKDGGVPWIGEIPEGWHVSSVRWEFDNLDGRRKPISAENRISIHGSYDYYGASGVIDKIDEFIFDEPLILIGEDGANLALRNLPLIYIATGKYWVNNHAHILKPKINNNLSYMAYQLECVDLFHFLTGSTQPKLTQANLSKIPVACPPLSEQHRIAAYLDAKCAEIDAIIAQKQELLDKLAAYRKSLIFECVTGKREVAA